MKKVTLLMALVMTASLAFAKQVTVEIYQTQEVGQGKKLGTIELVDTKKGLLIKPDLKDLPPGPHGFHVHEKPSCKNMGLAAGGHYDPQNTDKHLGPYNNKGHAGDLPRLLVDKSGETIQPLLAPYLKVKDLKGRAVIIHEGGDNYADKPKPLGGGGARIACGVVN